MSGRERKGPVTELVEKYAALEQECAEHKDQYMRSLADFDNYRRRAQRDFETVREAALESLVGELLPVLDNFDRALATVRTGLNTKTQGHNGVEAGPEESEGEVNRQGHQERQGSGQTDFGMNRQGRQGSEEPQRHRDEIHPHPLPPPQGGGNEREGVAPAIDKLREGILLIRRQLYEALGRHGVEEFSCLGQEFDPRRAEAVSFVHSEDHEPNTVVEEQCKGYSCRGKVIRPAKVVVAKRTEKMTNDQ